MYTIVHPQSGAQGKLARTSTYLLHGHYTSPIFQLSLLLSRYGQLRMMQATTNKATKPFANSALKIYLQISVCRWLNDNKVGEDNTKFTFN
jgi:hypothetical protein